MNRQLPGAMKQVLSHFPNCETLISHSHGGFPMATLYGARIMCRKFVQKHEWRAGETFGYWKFIVFDTNTRREIVRDLTVRDTIAFLKDRRAAEVSAFPLVGEQ